MVQPPADWVPPDGSSAAANSGASTGSSIDMNASAAASPAAEPAPTPLPPTTTAETATLRERWAGSAAEAPPPARSSTSPPPAADVPLRGEDWLSPRQRWMRRYVPQIAAALVGIVVTSALWYAFGPSPAPPEEPGVAAPLAAPQENPPPQDEPPTEQVATPAPPDAQWVRAPAPGATEPDAGASEAASDLPRVVAPPPPPIAQTPPDIGADNAANDGAEPEKPARDPLPVVDVPARLNDAILKLDYVKTPLVDFLGALSSFSTIPITIDVDALADAGLRVDAPVTVRKPKLTVAQALDAALTPLKLRYVVADQHVVVTIAESDAASPPVRREVNDLVAGDAGGTERLALLIERLVEPTSWQAERTTTSVRVDGSALVIVQSPRVVRKIDALLAALRAARRDPVGAALAPPPALETRPAMARDALGKMITLNYTTPTPLGKILARLAESSKMRLVVDWQALAGESIGPATPTRMIANDATVEQALAALVEPLSLAVRVIDARTVEITTQDDMAGNPELAAFPLADLAGEAAAFAAIGDKLRQQFGPAVSLSADGEGRADSGIAWHLDAPSKTLFILAPQASLVQLDAVFRDARAKQKR